MLIEGCKNGSRVEVSDDNRLYTESVTTKEIEHVTKNHGTAYIWDYPGYDYDAADTIMFLRNDDPSNDLVIDHIHLYCDTASKVQVHCPANPTAAGTAVTGYNLNRTSGNTALTTAKQDETGNTQGTVFISTYMAAHDVIKLMGEVGRVVVLGYHDCIAIDIVTAGTMAYGHIMGYYHEH